MWKIKLSFNIELQCADNHLIQTTNGLKYARSLTNNDFVETVAGPCQVLSVEKTETLKHMYDLLNVEDHLYYTNNILSHNTATISSWALWYAIFNEGKFVGIVSNKFESAKDFLTRIKSMYEALPDWLKPGVKEYNKHSITFDNNTRIQIAATSQSSFRGRSINVLICLEGSNKITVRNKNTGEIKTITIKDFSNILESKHDACY